MNWDEFVLNRHNLLDIFPGEGVQMIKVWDEERAKRRYILLRFEFDSGETSLVMMAPNAHAGLTTLALENGEGSINFLETAQEADLAPIASIMTAYKRSLSIFR